MLNVSGVQAIQYGILTKMVYFSLHYILQFGQVQIMIMFSKVSHYECHHNRLLALFKD